MTNRRMLGTLLMASLAMVFGTPALPQAYPARAVTIGECRWWSKRVRARADRSALPTSHAVRPTATRCCWLRLATSPIPD